MRDEAVREQRRNVWIGAALVVAGMGAAVALALTTGYEVPEPDPCGPRIEAPCLLPDGTVAWEFGATGEIEPVSREQYRDFMLQIHDEGY